MLVLFLGYFLFVTTLSMLILSYSSSGSLSCGISTAFFFYFFLLLLILNFTMSSTSSVMCISSMVPYFSWFARPSSISFSIIIS